jgi:hypothetical protein
MNAVVARRTAYAVVMAGMCVSVAPGQQRRWIDDTGKNSVDAEFVETKDGTVVIRRTSGKTVKVPIARLSAADQKYVAEQQAVAVIKQLGGEVESQPRRYLAHGVRLNGSHMNDQVFESIKDFSELEWLDVSYSKISDAGLRHLVSLPKLRRLELDGCQITDAGLQHIKGLKNLSILSLNGTQITDDGMKVVTALSDLAQLRLDKTAITDTGLELIGDLQRLSILTELLQFALSRSNTE